MNILLLCKHNSARSIIAEALMKHHCGDQHHIVSAGFKPTQVAEKALSAMQNYGLATDSLHSKSLNDVANQAFDLVITLCANAATECAGQLKGDNIIEWHFNDPAQRSEPNAYELTLHEINQQILDFVHAEQPNVTALQPLQFYKLMADDIRLKTLLLITIEQELCVCEIMAALAQTSQPKVSRHLAQLRNAGVLADRKHQQWVFYSLNPTLPLWMKKIITDTALNESELILPALNLLNKMGDRPTRINNCCN